MKSLSVICVNLSNVNKLTHKLSYRLLATVLGFSFRYPSDMPVFLPSLMYLLMDKSFFQGNWMPDPRKTGMVWTAEYVQGIGTILMQSSLRGTRIGIIR